MGNMYITVVINTFKQIIDKLLEWNQTVEGQSTFYYFLKVHNEFGKVRK